MWTIIDRWCATTYNGVLRVHSYGGVLTVNYFNDYWLTDRHSRSGKLSVPQTDRPAGRPCGLPNADLAAVHIACVLNVFSSKMSATMTDGLIGCKNCLGPPFLYVYLLRSRVYTTCRRHRKCRPLRVVNVNNWAEPSGVYQYRMYRTLVNWIPDICCIPTLHFIFIWSLNSSRHIRIVDKFADVNSQFLG